MPFVLDRDALGLVAAELTREEAGRLLAPLCRAGAASVRGADAAADGGWREGVPLWNLARTHERLERKYAVDGEDAGGLELVLQSLTRELDFLRAAGVVELVFDRAAACAGKPASVLGCHTLRVVDPLEFLMCLERWTVGVMREGRHAPPILLAFAGPTASHAVINLLRELGLKRPDGRYSRFGRHPAVARSEPLWHKKYVAM
jgi:hypothetical protein